MKYRPASLTVIVVAIVAALVFFVVYRLIEFGSLDGFTTMALFIIVGGIVVVVKNAIG
jgi:hypothetical protein